MQFAMAFFWIVVLICVHVVVITPVQSFSITTRSSVTPTAIASTSRIKQRIVLNLLSAEAETESPCTGDKYHQIPSVVDSKNHNRNKEDDFGPDDGIELETRRMFVGLVAVGLGSSLLGATPEAAFAKESISSADTYTAIATDGTIHSSSNDPFVTASTTLELSDAAAAAGVDWNSILKKASKRALGGGKAGASAAVIQVLSLMWLRTSMNRQYRYGGDLASSLKELWKEGGIPRLYQGLPFALVQGPLTRFGDTAANVGILALLESIPETQTLPLPVKTALGSISAGLWRIFLMPIDSSKTAMQVEGEDGLKELLALVKQDGPSVFYNGAVAQAAATAAGHFPWFLTYNYVDQLLPAVSASDDLLLSLGRSALLGLCASSVSDVTSNSLRVIKTTKQTARLGGGATSEYGNDDNAGKQKTTPTTTTTSDVKKDNDNDFSYAEIVQMIIEKDGLAGLFGRGLQTRLLTNALQGALFSVLFKYFQQT